MLTAASLATVAGAPGVWPVAVGAPPSGALPARAPQASVLVRTGDPAPVQARVGFINSFGLARLPGGGLAFLTYDQALLLRDAGGTRILLHQGQSIPGCGTVSEILDLVAGADGSLAVRMFCDQRAAIARVDPAGGSPSVVLKSGTLLPGLESAATAPPGLGAILTNISGPALDGEGRLVAAVQNMSGVSALVRLPKGGDPEILLRSGDPLGSGTLQEILLEPAVNSAGTIAFNARISGGREVIATLSPGSAPEVLVTVPQAGDPPVTSQFTRPALNDSGVVAFLRVTERQESGFPVAFEVQRARNGAIETLVAAGSPAPGGGTFAAIDWLEPAVEATGGVLFGARRTNGGGNTSLYRYDEASSVVAESGQEIASGTFFGPSGSSAAMLPCPDGSVLFAGSLNSGTDWLGSAILVERGGSVSVEARSGETLDEPARFTRIGNGGSHLASGPDMSADGAVIFDATATGRERGLYARHPDGTIVPVALDGDPAPGGGVFSGWTLESHTIASGGRVAFLGSRREPWGRRLFTGVLGGPLVDVIGEGESLPGFGFPIVFMMPPSKIDATGVVVVPVLVGDGRSLLLRWDGTELRVIAATGDPLPGGETIESIRTGSPDAPLAPLLDGSGGVIFGVVTSSGTSVLYRMPTAGGTLSAVRLVGDDDPVEGGALQPFRLQAMSIHPDGSLAFQAVTVSEPEPLLSTFLAPGDAIPSRLAGPGDTLPGPRTVIEALPRLAATTSGIVHEASVVGFDGGRLLWLATPSSGSTPAFEQQPLFTPGGPSPDGGSFADAGGSFIGPGFGGGPPVTPPPKVSLNRLGTDGDRFVVSVESTLEGAEILTRFDLRPEHDPPVAAAGPNQSVQCSGPDGAAVVMDGRGSSDPESGTLEYTWSTWLGTATGPTPTLQLPIGIWEVELRVRNPLGLVGVDKVLVNVADTVAPTLAVSADPEFLWPPDGRLRPVTFAVAAQDVCDPSPMVALVSVTSNDARTAPSRDVSGADYGTDDRTLSLRARRSGRTYTVTYETTDGSGNRTSGTATVRVPRRPPR